MADREKVISAIEVLDDFFGDDNKIHTVSPSEAWEIIRKLLKEKEPKKPLTDEYRNKRCVVCGNKLQSIADPDLFCCKCGQEVKWE